MKILLISPGLKTMDVYQTKARGCMPPLNLMYIAALLLKHGHEVSILDLYAEELSEAEKLARIKDFNPALVGLATYTASFDMAAEAAALAKNNLPGVKVAAGGIHASYLPEVCLKNKNMDFVVLGEGEETFLELAACLEKKGDISGIAGLAYRSGDKTVFTPPRKLAADLNALPWPAHHLVDFGKYYLGITRAVTSSRAASVLTMRGCPYKCTFCSHHYGYGANLRKRAPADVVAEIKSLYDKYGIREIQFEDPSFTCDPGHVKEICRLIKKSGLKINWNCNVRANTSGEELFREMSEAGCRRVLLGVESGSQEMLDSMKKGVTLEQIRNTVRLAAKYKMRVNAAFILGTPGETFESARKTFDFAKELDPDYVMFSVYIPSVGGELFENLSAGGGLDLDKVYGADYVTVYSEREPMVEMSAIPSARLLALMEEFTRGFYFRPAYILKRLRWLTSFAEVSRVLWGVALIFSHQFRTLLKAGKRPPKDKNANSWTY